MSNGVGEVAIAVFMQKPLRHLMEHRGMVELPIASTESVLPLPERLAEVHHQVGPNLMDPW